MCLNRDMLYFISFLDSPIKAMYKERSRMLTSIQICNRFTDETENTNFSLKITCLYTRVQTYALKSLNQKKGYFSNWLSTITKLKTMTKHKPVPHGNSWIWYNRDKKKYTKMLLIDNMKYASYDENRIIRCAGVLHVNYDNKKNTDWCLLILW